MDDSSPQELLSDRERDVLSLVASGLSSKEIARHLTISVGGANFHINNAMKKLGASSRAHAVALAIFHGIIPGRPGGGAVFPGK